MKLSSLALASVFALSPMLAHAVNPTVQKQFNKKQTVSQRPGMSSVHQKPAGQQLRTGVSPMPGKGTPMAPPGAATQPSTVKPAVAESITRTEAAKPKAAEIAHTPTPTPLPTPAPGSAGAQ